MAVQDATDRGFSSLGDYYSARGEAPGVWLGRGVAAVPDFPAVGERVTEEQMTALFGKGRHPNADSIMRTLAAQGVDREDAERASRLGRPFPVYEASNEFRRRCAERFGDYNAGLDLPGGKQVPEAERALIRTALAREMFCEQYGRDPQDQRELAGHLARISRQPTTAVAGYDLTFSPVKSVSTLWAIASAEVAAVIERAHADAVADTVAWLEAYATYSRIGPAGVAQVEVQGLIAAAFAHRDSRAGDPDLHTHVAISNKVQTLGDGRWLALDGRMVFKSNVAASERYNTRLEALLTERLGVVFADRSGTDPGKRPVREIVGVEEGLSRSWSSRRAAIDARRAALSARFQADHDRPPTAKEAVALAQRANLETRQRKHEPRSAAEQRAAWRAEAVTVLGDESRLHWMIRTALRGGVPGRRLRAARQPVTGAWIARTADRVLETVQAGRATWQATHVRAEAERHARGAGIRYAELDRAVDRIVAEALSPDRSIPLGRPEAVSEPDALRRSDGTSVFTVAGAQLYTSAEILAAERTIVAAAGLRGGRTVPASLLDAALQDAAAAGAPLTPGQVQLVRELTTSAARVQLALAPAGTGKTTAMRALSRAWTTGGGTVLGLAPSAAAAAVLAGEIGVDTDTLAKLVWHLRGGPGTPPAWIAGIGPDTLVIVDEAGMAGTTDLATVIHYVLGRGGSVRLIGDDRQLAAVGCGGVLRDLAAAHGAVTLSQVLRFVHPPGHPQAGEPNHAEGAASLALRDGDPSAIAFYLDHCRVHVGDLSTATADAYTAWTADQARGIDSILLAPTRELVTNLNIRARADRLAATGRPVGREVRLADGCPASAGDTIITRRNDRTLPTSATDWVKNGDRWRIHTVHDTGALDVSHVGTGRRVTLPADYAAAQATLGYAVTVHAAQGTTADTCHTVATGEESRQLLYVAMTRGRTSNHVYLATAADGDEHRLITRDALLPPTADELLARILARDAAPVSATSTDRDLADPGIGLAAAVARYAHALDVAAADHLGADALAGLDATAETVLPGLTRTDAYPVLRGQLAQLTLAGHDAADLLHRAVTSRRLDDARDFAAVLEWRLNPTGPDPARPGPLSWLRAAPDALLADVDWGDYLRRRASLVAELAGQVAARTRAWAPASAPGWALPLLDRDPALVADLAVWRAVHAVENGDWRPTGAPQPATADARAQRALDQRVTRILGDPSGATGRWAPLAHGVDPRLTRDSYWPVLTGRLTAADRAGLDIAALVRAVAANAPLPDEQPAAALWWRLAGNLSPAALAATTPSAADTLRPDWTPTLIGILGDAAAARILADPAWPVLVASITEAERIGWPPELSLAIAYELLHGAQPDDEPLRPEELATAMAWRIGLLTAPPSCPATHSWGPSGAHGVRPDAAVPRDLDVLAESRADLDEDWLASLLADPPHPDPDPDPDLDSTAFGDAGGDGAEAGDPLADILSALQRAEEKRWTAAEQAEHFWATAAVPQARLVELNAAAEAFFAGSYRDAWVADYLRDRLGTDLADDQRFSVGYAPADWTALTRHLRRQGATDLEILAAGLGTRTRTGRIIDRFRDRIIFPIKAASPENPAVLETRGFIARRNPTATDNGHDTAGPKYLNTADTDLFTKGHQLYGLAEHAAALTAGATPVLVEGPMDAIAVTLAADGRYIGVAPLGTALTDIQADALRPYLSARIDDPDTTKGRIARRPVVVATDADHAGHQAAHRAFWHLVARGEDPRRLILPHGRDPADLLQTDGPAALQALLDAATPLAEQVIAARTAPHADQLDTIDGRVQAMRRAADVIGALPPATWLDRATTLADALGLALPTVLPEVLAAGEAWIDDPRGRARQRLAERLPDPPPAIPTHPVHPVQRWAALVDDLAPSLVEDPHWPVLADHLTRAADTGYDVDSRLPLLLAQHPLPDRHAARDLDLRLVDDCPDFLAPAGSGAADRRPPSASVRPDNSPAAMDPAPRPVASRTVGGQPTVGRRR